MELKFMRQMSLVILLLLLIVPYGIEMWNRENEYNSPKAF